MACRESEKAKKALQEVRENHPLKDNKDANTEHVILEFIDLSDLASVKGFVDRLLLKGVQMDVLINNAGVILSERKLTKDGFEMQVNI
jgi:NADP-dependent 3-hydroxy acid dehydrogenase YdfG